MTSKYLRELQSLRAAIPAPADNGQRILVVYPDDWPEDVQDAFTDAQAAGATEGEFRIVEGQTGERLSRNPQCLVIAIRRYPGNYGPQ
jgi:hypothetical protein